jgi:hypothetical protein
MRVAGDVNLRFDGLRLAFWRVAFVYIRGTICARCQTYCATLCFSNGNQAFREKFRFILPKAFLMSAL